VIVVEEGLGGHPIEGLPFKAGRKYPRGVRSGNKAKSRFKSAWSRFRARESRPTARDRLGARRFAKDRAIEIPKADCQGFGLAFRHFLARRPSPALLALRALSQLRIQLLPNR
jgi:hypothetical protein